MSYDWRRHLQSNGGRAGRRFSGITVGGAEILSKEELLSIFLSPTFNVDMALRYVNAALSLTPSGDVSTDLRHVRNTLELLLGELEGVVPTTGAPSSAGPQEELWNADLSEELPLD